MFSFHLHEQGWKRDVFSLSSNCSDAKDMEAHKPCGVHGTHTFLRQWVVGFGVWWFQVAVKIQWLVPLAIFKGLLSDEDASGGVWPAAPSAAPGGHLTFRSDQKTKAAVLTTWKKTVTVFAIDLLLSLLTRNTDHLHEPWRILASPALPILSYFSHLSAPSSRRQPDKNQGRALMC